MTVDEIREMLKNYPGYTPFDAAIAEIERLQADNRVLKLALALTNDRLDDIM